MGRRQQPSPSHSSFFRRCKGYILISVEFRATHRYEHFLNKWKSTVGHFYFSHSSRKTWKLLHKLGEDSNIIAIDPNKIANRLVEVSRAPPDTIHTVSTKKFQNNLKQTLQLWDTHMVSHWMKLRNTQVKPNESCWFRWNIPQILFTGAQKCESSLRIYFFSDIMKTFVIPLEFK